MGQMGLAGAFGSTEKQLLLAPVRPAVDHRHRDLVAGGDEKIVSPQSGACRQIKAELGVHSSSDPLVPSYRRLRL